MADVNTNEIFTRIQLKYDSYNAWKTNNPTLLPGEVAIAKLVNDVTVPVEEAKNAPVLFKVGPGAFNDLPWVSGLAADVYAWAKQADVAVTGDGNAVTNASIVGDKLTFTKGTTFATKAELDAAVEAFGGDISAITDNDHRYAFAIVDGKLQVTETAYVNGKAGATDTKTYDFVTPDELDSILGDYYDVEEIDAKIAEVNKTISEIDTGVHSVALTGGTNNGTLKLIVDGTETDNIAVTGIEDIKVKNAYHADAAAKVDNALTVKVGGTDVVFDGFEAKTVDVDAAINAAKVDYTVTCADTDHEATESVPAFKRHTLTQNGKQVCVIDVPRDLVIKSGSVDKEKNELVLVLVNDEEIRVDVSHLIEYVTGGTAEDGIITVDVDDNFVATATINDNTITEAKLHADVVAKLNKDDNTTYVFANKAGTDLTFTVTPSEGDAYDVTLEANGKADKVTGATAGNFAGLDANGNLTDSGKKASDFKTVQEAKNYDGSTIKTVTNVKQNANGEVEVTYADIAFPADPVASGSATIATVADDVVTLKAGAVLGENHTLANDANADITLAKVAKTGNIADLVQTTGTYIVFNCGTSTTVI